MQEISVIVPTYKPDYYIWKCLNSIVSQSLDRRNYEVLIILNGDKEPFFTEIESYLKNNNLNNFHLIYTQEKGVSNARNIGLDRAKGDYICFVDDDDFLDKNYLEEMLRVVLKYGNDGIVVSNFLNFDEKTGLEKNRTNYILGSKEKKFLKMRKVFSNACGKLLPLRVIADIRFNKKFKNGEDSLFMGELSKNIKYIAISEKEVYYNRRLRADSASRKKKKNLYILSNTFLLILSYSKLLFKKSYNKIFILARIIAVMKGMIIQFLNNKRRI